MTSKSCARTKLGGHLAALRSECLGGWCAGSRQEVILSEAKDLGGGKPEEFPSIEMLIPHRGPARLLERILECGGDRLVAEAAIPADSPLRCGADAPAFLALEMAAQAAAALAALGQRETAGPRSGYLVGVRNATFHVPYLEPNDRFRVAVQCTGAAGALAVYDFTAHSGETLLASGTISTYLVL